MAKIQFYGKGILREQDYIDNTAYMETLGLPKIEDAPLHDTALAVVGGGPSIVSHLDEIRSFPGHVWGVNGAFNWCKRNGIKSVYVTVDPKPPTKLIELGPSDEAIVADYTCPVRMERLLRKGPRIRTYKVHPEGRGWTGPSTASVAMCMAPIMGYQHITFFGCESCFSDQKHAYPSDDYHDLLEVDVAGEKFLTAPQLIIQAEVMSAAIRKFPHIYRERSGGLLSALVEHGEENYNVTRVSRSILEGIEQLRADNERMAANL